MKGRAVTPPSPAPPLVRFTGRLDALTAEHRARLIERAGTLDAEVRARAEGIVERVRRGGDAAIRALAGELERASPERLEVPLESCREELARLDAGLRGALERAARNLATVHQAQRPSAIEIESEPGVIVGRVPQPLGRVGVYAPGGRAAYPSSVLMGVVPAKVAGVGEVVLCSPPGGPDGRPAPLVLAAAALAGADRVFAIGGASAVAAMAYGTQSVPRVDRIVGPGNAYVAAAKLAVQDAVAIDAPAGPSEIVIVADSSADPCGIARELLAQAEHDPDACSVALVVGERLAGAVLAALAAELERAPRREIAAASLASRGAVLVIDAVEQAWPFVNGFAPEHLQLCVEEPMRQLEGVRNAGTVFLGASASVAFGDYLTGANHVLPTSGLARAWSGLSVLEFYRWTTYQRVSAEAAARLAGDTVKLAETEGLYAHAEAARAWEGASDPAADRLSRRSADGAGEPLLTPQLLDSSTSDDPSTAAALRVASAQGERIAASAQGEREPHLRRCYADIDLYSPDRTPCEVDLSDNTNLFGVPPAALRILREAPEAAVTRYPRLYADALKSALADYIGVAPAAIATGCGSDDVLDSAIRAFSEPGDRIAFSDPTFSMLPLFARMNGLDAAEVPLRRDFDVDAEALLATGARIIYLCSPNNPTGTPVSAAAVETILERAPGLVILDEAYAEYARESFARVAPTRPNLLVARTLSKAFGLAGIRIGYAVGAPRLVAEVEKSRGPYKVNALAEAMAVAALREDGAWVRARVEEIVSVRTRFRAALVERGFAPLPSEANFVLVPVREAAAAARQVRARGVALRPFPALRGIGDALRISLGPWPLMEAALRALEGIAPCV